jgi:transposase InsO family protein
LLRNRIPDEFDALGGAYTAIYPAAARDPNRVAGQDLIAELDRLAAQPGTPPAVLRCDNGPELACTALAEWARDHVGPHFIPPGEPWRNGYVESFNSRARRPKAIVGGRRAQIRDGRSAGGDRVRSDHRNRRRG